MQRQLQTNSHFRPINWAKFRKTEQLDSFIMELIIMKICFQIIIEERILMYGSQKESGCRLSQRTWRARTTLGMACRIWSSSIRGPTTETQISIAEIQISTTYLHVYLQQNYGYLQHTVICDKSTDICNRNKYL